MPICQLMPLSDLFDLWKRMPTCACLSASLCIWLFAHPSLWAQTVCLYVYESEIALSAW